MHPQKETRIFVESLGKAVKMGEIFLHRISYFAVVNQRNLGRNGITSTYLTQVLIAHSKDVMKKKTFQKNSKE